MQYHESLLLFALDCCVHCLLSTVAETLAGLADAQQQHDTREGFASQVRSANHNAQLIIAASDATINMNDCRCSSSLITPMYPPV